jgi:hypothetical protein
MLGTLPTSAQDGLRLPGRGWGTGAAGTGIDPSFAPGWFNPERDRLGLAPNHWRDAIGFAPTHRVQWSYAFGQHSTMGISIANGRDFDAAPVFGAESRQFGFFGRYSLAPDWSFNAETTSREPRSLFRLQDFRIGLRRQF